MSLKLAQIVAALISFGLGLAQTFYYLRVRKIFNSLPIVSAEIIGSRLLHQLDLDNKDLTQAIINFKYSYQGDEHESSSPVLRGFELFPSFDYERALVKKYRPGDRATARVVQGRSVEAYLEVAPLSRASYGVVLLLVIFPMVLVVSGYLGYTESFVAWLKYHVEFWLTL